MNSYGLTAYIRLTSVLNKLLLGLLAQFGGNAVFCTVSRKLRLTLETRFCIESYVGGNDSITYNYLIIIQAIITAFLYVFKYKYKTVYWFKVFGCEIVRGRLWYGTNAHIGRNTIYLIYVLTSDQRHLFKSILIFVCLYEAILYQIKKTN